jgi:hypothetical protein
MLTRLVQHVLQSTTAHRDLTLDHEREAIVAVQENPIVGAFGGLSWLSI